MSCRNALAAVTLAAVLSACSSHPSGACYRGFRTRDIAASVPKQFCWDPPAGAPGGPICGPLTLATPVGGRPSTALPVDLVWMGLVAPGGRRVTPVWLDCPTLARVDVHETDDAVGVQVFVRDCVRHATPSEPTHWYGTTISLRDPIGKRELRNDGPEQYNCD